MSFGPTPFPRQPVRAVVINPDRMAGCGYIVGALERRGGETVWIEHPTRTVQLGHAWTLARAIRGRTGLPILDRHDTPARPVPTGGIAA